MLFKRNTKRPNVGFLYDNRISKRHSRTETSSPVFFNTSKNDFHFQTNLAIVNPNIFSTSDWKYSHSVAAKVLLLLSDCKLLSPFLPSHWRNKHCVWRDVEGWVRRISADPANQTFEKFYFQCPSYFPKIHTECRKYQVLTMNPNSSPSKYQSAIISRAGSREKRRPIMEMNQNGEF